jgi:uncharacterized membrane protein
MTLTFRYSVGTGLGTGVGAVVGTLVGGVTAIPTTTVGLLVGVGTGAIHGPWVKVKGKKDGQEDIETLEEDEKLSDQGAPSDTIHD